MREVALDALEDLYRGYDDAKAPIKKLAAKLAVWRPGGFQDGAASRPQQQEQQQVASTTTNAMKAELPFLRKPSPPQQARSAAAGTPVQTVVE